MDVSKQTATKANDLFTLARKDAIANGPICGIVQKKIKVGLLLVVLMLLDAIQNPQKLAQDVSRIGKFKTQHQVFKIPGDRFGIAGAVGAAIGAVRDLTTTINNLFIR